MVKVGLGSNNYESNGFYQLYAKTDNSDDRVLVMEWNSASKKYELKLVKIDGANVPLDATLWKISASWDRTSGNVNYIFANKATLLPLQVAVPEEDVPAAGYTTPVTAAVEGSVTNWLWNTNVEDLESARFTSLVSTTEKVWLVRDKSGTGETIKVVKTASNGSQPNISNYVVIGLKAVEAGRVILTAEQINTKLNNAEGVDATRIDFVFDPEVQNPDPELAKNIMSETAFVARGAEFTLQSNGTLQRDNSTAPKIPDFKSWVAADKKIDGKYVQFASYKEPSKVLMVDTAYYDEGQNNYYDLKLAVKELKKNEGTYNVTSITNTAYATFQDQSLFKVVYEPTFDRILIQAK